VGYIEENLMKDETVIFKTKKHWISYIWWGLVSCVLCGGPIGIVSSAFCLIRGEFTAGILFLLWAIVSSLPLLFCYISIKTSEFGVTNQRVIIKTGVFRTDTYEILIAKIESIQVSQGIIGKWLNYGNLVIRGTGGTPSLYREIINPFEFRASTQKTNQNDSKTQYTSVVKCPHCAEDIKKEAKICKHCGRDI